MAKRKHPRVIADYRNNEHLGASRALDPAELTNRLCDVAILLSQGEHDLARKRLNVIINEVGQTIVPPSSAPPRGGKQSINAVTGNPRRPMEEIEVELEGQMPAPDDWLTDDNIAKLKDDDSAFWNAEAPHKSTILPFRELCELIRMEVLHTFYNSYRGRSTRTEMVEEITKHNFDDLLELNFEQFLERRGAPWIFYPLRQYA